MGTPNDHLERQADEIANQVMRTPPSHVGLRPNESPSTISTVSGESLISRKCESCAKDEESEEQIQAKMERPGSEIDVSSSIEAEITGAIGVGGQPLPQATRDLFEPRFGRSLAHVRLHVGGGADELVGGLGARAFTVGSDIFMRPAEYRPNTYDGQHLMAHELTHTIQQQRQSPSIQRAVQSVDPFYEIIMGRVVDNHQLLDLLRGLEKSQLKRLRKSLEEHLELEDSSDFIMMQVEAAIEEIGSILRGQTAPIVLKRCETEPATIPSSVWLGNTVLVEVREGTRQALRVGDRGFHVELVQSALRDWGCKMAIPTGEYLGKYGADGVFGKRTRDAVKEFQNQHGLQRDGRVGPLTLAALEEVAVVPDGESDAPHELTCPPRAGGERERSKTTPLSVTSTSLGEVYGHEVKKWVISGFAVDESEPLSSQGKLRSMIGQILPRLKHLGVKTEDPPNQLIDPENDGIVCDQYSRFAFVFGAGDCHAPERNTDLKINRSYALQSVWPESLAHRLFVPDESTQATYESKFGEFPAGNNATEESRAKNRGVVLVEDVLKQPRDPKILEFERNRHKMRVQSDFKILWDYANSEVTHPVFQCMMGKIEFNGQGLPVLNNKRDEYVFDEDQVGSIVPGRPPRPRSFLGPDMLTEAKERSIWAAKPGEDPITICGKEILPPKDAKVAMFEVANDILDKADVGKVNLNEAIQMYGEGQLYWLRYNDQIGGVYSCYPDKKWWNIFPSNV